MSSVDTAQDEDAVASVILRLYRALGDRPAFDDHLHEDITIWESDADDMLHGTAQLDDLRDRRAAIAADSAAPVSVAPESITIDVWGDSAVARYVLKAVYDAGTEDECFRVTDVLRRIDGRWLIVHHHSESLTETR
jgi:ketosteroid isomerase-like protein